MLSLRRKSKMNGPLPLPLFGTGFSMFYQVARYGLNEYMKRMHKKHGDVYINFLGSYPIVMVANPELAKNIAIKDFKNFTNRPVNNLKKNHLNSWIHYSNQF